MTTKNTNAAEAYAARRDEVARLLDLIEQELKVQDARQAEEPGSWGHAGSMGHVREELTNLLAFISGVEVTSIEECLDDQA